MNMEGKDFLVHTVSDERLSDVLTTTKSPVDCYQHVQYEAHDIAIAGICLIAGLICCFLGYRLLKTVLFLIGLLFTSSLVYLILDRQHRFSLPVDISISISCGLIIGLVALCLPRIGIFLAGLISGALIGTVIAVVWQSFVVSPSLWAVIGLLIGNGLIMALISLVKWQRSLIIINTSFIGAVLLASALDYFVNHWTIIRRAWESISGVEKGLIQWDGLCWYGWVVLAVWPCIFALGTIVQWNWTGVGREHHMGCSWFWKERSIQEDPTSDTRLTASRTDSCKHSLHGSTRQLSNVCTDRKEPHSLGHRRCSNGTDCAHRSVSYESKPWKNIYQSRRAHGDVICQSYLESLQRLSSQTQRTPLNAYSPWRSLGSASTGLSEDQTNVDCGK